MNKSKWRWLLLFIICMMPFFCCMQSKASAGTVTSYEKITWGISTGRYAVNGIHAFCAEYSKTFPTVGTSIDSIVECNNELVRKALYYGYNGPQNVLGTDNKAHVLTAIAISDANIGERATGASAKYDEFYWDLVNNPSNYPSPPSKFKAYLAITTSEELQDLAFYQVEKNGYVRASKTSTDSSLTNNHNCYSLEGAQYGLYTSATLSESSKVGVLVMDVNGQSNTVELSRGTYYAREIAVPKGYAKSTAVTTFSVTPEQTTTLHFSDEPQVNPIDVLLKKVDAETGKSSPQGLAKLKGANFTVKYYAGVWDQGVDPATKGKVPVRTWVFKTDESGIVRFQDSYKVSGDALYSALPLGTITIQETKASEGYFINPAVFVRQITSSGEGKYVGTYSIPVVKEEVIVVEVTKYQSDTDIPIPGTVFEHISPNGDSEMVTTDVNGKIYMKGLCYGTHIVREVSPTDGYMQNTDSYEFVVDESTNQNMNITVYNDPVPYDLVIYKTDAYDNLLEGAEFVIYLDEECQEEFSRGLTDADGMLRIPNLAVGVPYYLKEIKAPAGYQLPNPTDQQIYEICAVSVPIRNEFMVFINDEEYGTESTGMYTVSGEKQNRQVNMNVINEVGYVLPKTGTSARLIMTLAGIALCMSSLYIKKNKTEKRSKTI